MEKLKEELIKVVTRRLVETLNSRSAIQNPSSNQARFLTIAFRHQGDKTLVKVDRPWFEGLLQRWETLKSLDSTVSEQCFLEDLYESFETASRVVLLLWSSLEITFNLDLNKHFEDLVISVMFYAPMCGEEQRFIPFLKYQLSWLFARGEGQKELPNKFESEHNDGIVLLGWLGRFFKSRCFGHSLKHREWRNTVLHGIKKGLPKMGKFHLEKNANAMIGRLCPEKVRTTPDCLLEEIERTAREIFPNGIVYEDWEDVDRFTTISDHCSYEYSRSKRGVLGTLLDELDWSDESRSLVFNDLGGMYYNPQKNVTGEIRFPGYTLDLEYKTLRQEAITDQVVMESEKITLEELEALFSTDKIRFYQELIKSCQYQYCELRGKAKVKPIFEPLKIRMITAGDYRTNGLYTQLQKKLWGGLQRFKSFQLTGKVVSRFDIEEVHDQTERLGLFFSNWVSGDYSAATDNLNRDASLAAIRAISGDPITYRTLRKGLMDTELDFDSCGLSQERPHYEMKSGQLMGCVFSFPILCIINLATYRAALEAYTGNSYELEELPVRVNGDDILFKTNKKMLKIWEGLIRKVGFEKSVGKNYVSPNFAIINSVYFYVRNIDNVYKVPYINMGWIAGEKKTGLESLDGEQKVGAVYPIKDQVKQVRFDWCYGPEFDCDSCNQIRRVNICDRILANIWKWRLDAIKESGYSIIEGPVGLDLLTVETDIEDHSNVGTYDYDEFYCCLYQDLKRTRKASWGLSRFPRTLVPWKMTDNVQENEGCNDYSDELEIRNLRKRYFSKSLKRRGILNQDLLDQYRFKEFNQFFSEIKSQYLVCGELLR